MSDVDVTKKTTEKKSPQRASNWLHLGFPKSRLWSTGAVSLAREMSEEMERFFRGINGGAPLEAWAPTIDIDRSNGTMVISAELPGLKKEDVKVEVTAESVVIQGERKQEKEEDREGYHRWERSYGHFYRAIPLPDGAQTDLIQADLKDGVLKVSIPVPETAKTSRQVPVNS
ncbi:MAG: Hsp20/alpha crystallin family protein [Bryobacter sp.]|jgi:HSP20 family protein|nr:Hsp20/alpha crystallin family protein [Bryobacter sp. CoA8 C33]